MFGIRLLGLTVLLSCHTASAQLSVSTLQRTDAVSFQQEILPILQRSCLACHSVAERQGELVLESPQAMLKGGDSGPAVVPGRAEESLMFQVAAHLEEPIMPPAGNDVNAPNFSSNELGLLKLWINQGARGESGVAVMSPKRMQALTRNSGPVNALAISPDGQFVVCGRGNQLVLCHTATGRIITRLTDPAITVPAEHPGVAHSDLIQSLAISDDGTMLASGSFREVKLWKKPADVILQTIANTATTGVMAVQPGGQLIAAVTANNAIQVWDSNSLAIRQTLTGFTAEVRSLVFSSDGGRLFAAAADQYIRAWDLETGTLSAVIQTPVELNTIALIDMAAPTEEVPHPEQVLVSGGLENVLRTWTVPTTAPARTQWSRPAVQHVASSPDGSTLLQVTAAGEFQVLSLSEQPEGSTEPQHYAAAALWKTANAVVTDVSLLRQPSESPEPVWAVAATAATQVSLHQLADGAILDSWQAGTVPLTSVTASSDGQLVATGSESGVISVWAARPAVTDLAAVAAGTPQISLLSDSGKHTAVAAQRQGRNEISLWNNENGQLIGPPLVFDGAITALALAADERTLAVATTDSRIRIWKADQPATVVHELQSNGGAAGRLAFSPDAAQILYSTPDHKLHLVQPGTEKEPLEFVGHTAAVLDLGFLSPGEVWSVSADQSARFWNSTNATQGRTFSTQGTAVATRISRDRQLLATIDAANVVRILQLSNGQLLQTLEAHPEKAVSVSFSPDHLRIAVCGEKGHIRIWQTADARLLEGFVSADIRAAEFSLAADSLQLLTSAAALQTRTMRYQRDCVGHQQPISELAFHSNGQTLYTTSADGTFRGYSVQNGQQAFAANHGAPIHDLAIAPGEQIFATAGENGVLRLWQGNGGAYGPQQITGPGGPLHAAAFSADAQMVLAAGSGETTAVGLWLLSDGQLQQSYAAAGKTVVDLRPLTDDGRILVTDAEGTTVDQLLAKRIIPGHGGAVTSLVALNGSPQQVFSSSLDGTARHWNLTNGQQVRQLAHGGPVHSVAVRGDGQRVATAGENARVRLWNINGQQISEMRGDIRLQSALVRAQQNRTTIQAKLNSAKQKLDNAEKDLPLKQTAAMTANETLATAQKSRQEKQTVRDKAMEEKVAAEKTAIELSKAAQTALLAKLRAEADAAAATAAVQEATTRANLITAASNAAPGNESLKQQAAQATAAVQTAQATAQKMTAAVPAPTQAATAAINAANEAAQVVNTKQKPYTDAELALATAESDEKLATQQQTIAARELKEAEAAVPAAKQKHTGFEQALVLAEKEIETATAQSTAAELPVRSVSFSPDGTLLASAGDFSSVHTWDTENGSPLAAFAGAPQAAKQVCFLDEARMVTSAADGNLRIWELNPSWELATTIGAADQAQVFSHRITGLGFSRDTDRLLVAGGTPSRSGELHVFNIADAKQLLHLPQAHDDVIYAAAFSPDGLRIASAAADRYLRTFDAESGEQLLRMEGHTNYVLGLAWKGDGSAIASAAADDTVKIWNSETGDQLRTINNFGRHVTAVRYIGETDTILTGSGNKLVRLYNSANGGNLRTFGGVEAWVHCVDTTQDGRLVAAGMADGTVKLWNGQNGQVLQTLTAIQQPEDEN